MLHDAIISKGEFQQVQQLLELDTRTAPSQTTVYPLSGFLRCADCGQKYDSPHGDEKRKEVSILSLFYL